jgi:pyruvate dehydrogenase complex dihydrolipoamide acetyltransferase long form
MATMRMREALNAALREEMERDESVLLLGEDIGVFEGAFKVTEGLMKQFGERRVRDMPISENTIVGTGVGAAMGGLRPVVELMTVNFSLLAFDQIINHAAAIPYMFNGQVRVPLVIRMPGGGGHQLGPTHSHSFEAMFLQIPGLLVACPSTAADGKALLKAAIRDDNPVVFIEHETLYGMRGEVPEDDDHVIDFGIAAVRREGADATIVGILKMAHEAERAAETLAEEHGIEAEVIDPRTLRPLDLDTILESVRKTNRVVIVEEGWPHGGVGANLAALIQEQAFDHLDAPVQRVTGADVPMPYSKRLEQSAIPHPEHIVSAVLQTTEGAVLERATSSEQRAAAAPVLLHDSATAACCKLLAAREPKASVLMPDVVMPRLSDSMEEGTVLAWMKAVGDEVAVGDELVEIETDKANMVYESDVAGTLTEIVAEEGATLPIGEVIARVGEAGSEQRAASSEQRADAGYELPAASERSEHAAGRAEPGRAASSSGGEAAGGRIKASPLARRIAGERGVDLAGLSGSGPGGRIVKADVEAAASGDGAAPEAPAAPEIAGPPSPPAAAAESPETARGSAEQIELTRLQQTIARRMAESKATAPHFYLTTEIDMSRAVEARARIKAAAGEGDIVPSFNDMVVKACALALREFPRANGAYRDGKVEEYSRINIGIAVAAQDALVVPTVFDADRKGLRQIAAESRAAAERVRAGTITPPELSGGTFTVSNLGMFGITSFSAVINPPQAAILAVGSIEQVPVVRDDAIVPGHRMSVNLACDHRILYGADGAKFVARVRDLLEEPVFLAM